MCVKLEFVILSNIPVINILLATTLLESINLPSHIQTVLSLLQVATRAPDLLHWTVFTSFSCPSNVVEHWNSNYTSHYAFINAGDSTLNLICICI